MEEHWARDGEIKSALKLPTAPGSLRGLTSRNGQGKDVKTGIIVLAVCAGFLVALLFALSGIAPREPLVAVLLFLLGLALVAPVAVAAIRGSFDPLESINLWLPLFGYVYLVKPLARILTGQEFVFQGENLERALAVSVLGLVAFYVGYYSSLGRFIARKVPVMGGELSRRRLRMCAWVCITVGALGFYFGWLEAVGGWRAFFSVAHGMAARTEVGTAYIYQLPELMVVAFFLILYDFISEPKRDLNSIARLFIASIGGIWVYTVVLGRRTFVGWALITGFVMWYLVKGKRPRVSSLVLFGLAMLTAITLTLAYRSYIRLGVSFAELASVDPLAAVTTTVSELGDEFDSFLAIVNLYPSKLPYDHFSIYGRIFIHPIPRLIWPEKPPLFVSSWDEFLYNSGISWGASESLLGDLYIQMGLLGVIIGMFTSGIVWRFLFAYLDRAPSRGPMVLLYAVAVGNAPSFIVQSAISAFWKWMPLMIPGTAFACWLASKKAQPHLARPLAWAPRRSDG